MIRINTTVLFCTLALVAAPAVGGPLAVDTNTVDGIWHGSTGFQGYNDPPANTDPSGLTGYLDWAVYAPDTFPGGFSGYSPTAGEYVYVYQAYETGAAPLTSLFVTLDNDADNIGQFTGDGGFGSVSGLTADFAQLVAYDSAQWYWFSGVPTSASTVGLAFSSPNAPMLSDATVIDDGTVGFVVPVPSPGGPVIPEPGTLTLASFGLLLCGLGWLRRRRRRA